MSVLKNAVQRHTADLSMSFITLIWSLHYIVMKSGMTTMAPLTYNALRFVVALPIMVVVALSDRAILRLPARDLMQVAGATLFGSVGYQILFAEALNLTTSTNTALLVATMPTWTALISISLGNVSLRRRMLVGIGLTLAGVALVVLARAGSSLSLSHEDVLGSSLALVAAVVAALSNILMKPLVDRLGTKRIAVWSYAFTTLGLLALAAPNLRHFGAANIPPRVWPNLLYSGVLSSALGFFVGNYGLRALGPTRYASYQNFSPVIASLAGILVLGEAVTPGLIAGGSLTLLGVVLVRQNTFIRPPRAAEPRRESIPSAAR